MRLAITGSIGSGKSIVSDYIRSKEIDVFDCDKTNSILLEKGNLGYIEVKKAFPQVFDGEELNKAKLAEIVFKNKDSRLRLESIMHPLIQSLMLKEANEKELFIAEVPLLFEANWDKYFDHSLLVLSDDEKTLNRLINRGLDKQDIINRLDNQMSKEDKLKRADEIIYNNSDLASLYSEVDKWLEKYVR